MVWKASGGGMSHETKKCRKCDTELVVGENLCHFDFDNHNYLCSPCQSKEKQSRHAKRKLEAIEYLGGKCADCGGVVHPQAYDFHHVDPSNKKGKVTQMLRQNSWKTIVEELDKCVLLCANCHRVRHATGELGDEL